MLDAIGDPRILALAAFVTFLAAGVQGLTGFGHALLAIGFLAILYGAREAVLILTLLAPVISVVVFVRHRRHVDWRESLWLIVPMLVAMGPGLWLFTVLDGGALRVLVGALLVVFTIWYASPLSPSRRRLRRRWAAAAGGSGGLLGGLTSTGGPPFVLYLLVHDLDKRTSMAVLQAVFVVGSVAKVVMAGAADLFDASLLGRSAVLALPLVAGVLLGQRVFDRLNATHVRRISLVLLGGMGIALLAGL